jgi:hypothetical protein
MPSSGSQVPCFGKTCKNFKKLHTSVINGNTISPRIYPVCGHWNQASWDTLNACIWLCGDVKLSFRMEVQRINVLT